MLIEGQGGGSRRRTVEPTQPRQGGTSKRIYRAVALLIAVGVVVQAAALAYLVGGLNRYLTTGRGGSVWETELYSAPDWLDAGVGLPAHLVTVFLVLPILAIVLVVVAFVTRVRGAVTWAAAIFVAVALQVFLDVVGADGPVVGAFKLFDASRKRTLTRTNWGGKNRTHLDIDSGVGIEHTPQGGKSCHVEYAA